MHTKFLREIKKKMLFYTLLFVLLKFRIHYVYCLLYFMLLQSSFKCKLFKYL